MAVSTLFLVTENFFLLPRSPRVFVVVAVATYSTLIFYDSAWKSAAGATLALNFKGKRKRNHLNREESDKKRSTNEFRYVLHVETLSKNWQMPCVQSHFFVALFTFRLNIHYTHTYCV